MREHLFHKPMKLKMLLSALILALGAQMMSTAGAQEVLPFLPAPSAELTMESSVHKKCVEPKRLADGAPFSCPSDIMDQELQYPI
jgi:hypothetical protein